MATILAAQKGKNSTQKLLGVDFYSLTLQQKILFQMKFKFTPHFLRRSLSEPTTITPSSTGIAIPTTSRYGPRLNIYL